MTRAPQSLNSDSAQEPATNSPELSGALDSLAVPRIAAIARLSAVDTVRARITMAINLGLLKPKERLPDADEMAHAFGVSRASILRGLTALQEEGVVERRAGRYGGSFVRPGTHHDADSAVRSFIEDDPTVHALIDERAVFEAGFAGIAAQSRSNDDIEHLRRTVSRMDKTSSWAEFRNLDRDFHRRIAEAARVPRALGLFMHLNNQLDPYFLPYNMELLHASNHEHRDITEALESQNSLEASTLVREHVQELHASMYIGLS